MRNTRKLEIIEFTLNLFFDLIKALIIKTHKCLRIFIDQLHVVTHSLRIGFNNVTQLGILRKARQDVLKYRRVIKVMVLLLSSNDHCATLKDNFTRKVFIGASYDAK
ncbi:hypothetical protein D3C72_1444930 [compost metagenome]